nr:zinc finger, CCHC-type [Tanacetum cinerariifolium]
MSVVYVLTTPIPEDGGDDPTVEQVRKRAKWDNNDYVCRGLSLNGMSDPLFDIYQNVESFKKLWDALEAKYIAKDASSMKFLVSNFINYKMTDSRLVMEQYNDLLGILRIFQAHLKHKKEELNIVELGSHLRIEESLKVHDSDKPKGNNVAGPSVVNMVEHNKSMYNDNKGKRKHYENTRDDPNKKEKHTCWKCGKINHIKRDCKGVNVGNKANGSSTKGSVDGSSNSMKGHNMVNKSLQVYYVSYVSDAYFVQDDDVAWYVDSGATVHECKDRCWFKTYESMTNGFILHMGNESTTLVHGRGCEDLKFSSRNCFDEALDKFKVFKTKVESQQGSLIKRFRTDSGDVIFDENRFSSVPRLSQRSLVDGTEDFGGSVVFEEVIENVVQQPEPELRKSKNNPNTFNEAIKSQVVAFWKKAINDEMDSIMGNNTWVLADLPLYYFDTYALVARISTIRLLIAMTSIHNLIIHQMDVKTTFLNGKLEEEVYINQPQGLIMPGNENKVDMKKDFLSSSHYIKKEVKKFNYFDCTPFSTPMDTSEKLMPNNGQVVSQLEHSRVKPISSISICCDSAVTLAKAYSQMYNRKSRHLGVRHSMIRELIMNGVASIEFVSEAECKSGLNDIYRSDDFSMFEPSTGMLLSGLAKAVDLGPDVRLACEGPTAQCARNRVKLGSWNEDKLRSSAFPVSSSGHAMSLSSEPGEMAPESSKAVIIPKFDMHVYTFKLTSEELQTIIKEYCILMDLGFAGSVFLLFLVVIKHFGVHVSQLVPMGVNRVILFKIRYMSLDIRPTVSLFRVFYKLCKQGHWFSFENKTEDHAKKCFKEVATSLKGWKRKFCLLDRRAVPDAMPWRHGDTNLHDDFLNNYDEVIDMDTFLKLPSWTGTVVSGGDPILKEQRPNPWGSKKRRKAQKNNESIQSGSEATLSATPIHQASPKAGKNPAAATTEIATDTPRTAKGERFRTGDEWRETTSDQVEKIQSLENDLDSRTQQLVAAEEKIKALEGENLNLLGKAAQSEADRKKLVREFIRAMVKRLHTSVEYRQSLATPVQLCYSAGWLEGLSLGRTEDQIAQFLFETQDLSIEGSKSWESKHREIFIISYPHFQKVANSCD